LLLYGQFARGVENMEQIPRDPKVDIYAADDYVHGLEITEFKRLLFVSGTMGLDEAAKAPDSLEAQLQLIWRNIETILRTADMTVGNIVRLTSYLRDPSFAEANQNARLRALNGRRIPTTAIVVQTLLPEWLVEIEVIAAAS
jgi:2-iminobutanoate/2-iminopropanoate deaminase